MIAIIDYGMGNLQSVWNALDAYAIDAEIINDPDRLKDYDRAILPGVGAFAKAMNNLNSSGFTEAIKSFVGEGRPMLGICLGMQLLAERGYEFGDSAGLGFIPGEVKPFDLSEEFLIPHVGWNSLEYSKDHPVFDGIKKNIDFYFVHSFVFHAAEDCVVAKCDYGGLFPAVVAKGNVIGAQFHPEKSQAGGLDILENFSNWDGVF